MVGRTSAVAAVAVVALAVGCARSGRPAPVEPAAEREPGGGRAREAASLDPEPVPSPASSPRSEVRPPSARSDEIAARVREAARGCADERAGEGSADANAVRSCVCDRLARKPFAPAEGTTVVSWPLPGTRSGSTATDDGIRLVPLGPVFEIAVDSSGAVERCGVAPPATAAGG